MREVFAAFDDKETIDSLGLGVIRDSISDQLLPGVSTIYRSSFHRSTVVDVSVGQPALDRV